MPEASTQLDRVIRRAELEGVQLAIPVELFPGEGIADAIFRASGENGYVTMSPISELLGLRRGTRINHFFMSKHDVDYSALSDVLGTVGGAAALRDIGYIQCGYDSEAISFFGTTIRRRSLHADIRRVAPSSLGHKPYQRAYWSLRALSFDPVTKELLLDHCPVCRRKLEYRATWGVERCGMCKQMDGTPTDLRSFPQPRLDVKDEEAIDFFAGLVLPRAESGSDKYRLPEELAEFGRGQVFELISAIAVSLDYQKIGKRSVSAKLEPSLNNLALAGRAIMEWPTGMRRLLSTLSPPRTGAHRYALRGLGKITFFDEKLRTLMRREAEASIYERVYSAVSTEKKVSKEGETRIFRDPWDELIELSRIINLDCNAPNRLTVDLGAALRASTKLGKVSEAVGLPVPFLVGLYSANHLPVSEPGLEPYFSRNSSPPSYSLDERIRLITKEPAWDKRGFSLLNAVLALYQGTGNPWPKVIDAILKRELVVWFDEVKRGPLVRRLVTADLHSLKRLLGTSEDLGYLNKMPLKKSELHQYFGVAKLHLLGAMGYELRDRCTLHGIRVVREKYILRKEIDVLLACYRGQEKRSVETILREAKISPCGANTYPIYLRSDVGPLFETA